VKYSDPHFPKFPSSIKYSFKDSSVKLTSASLKKFDLVVLLTKHKDFDYPLIKKYSKRIIDTRGVFAPNKKTVFRG
jgi:UDP-N-acetyl-D-glucosamine dehydrogenase